MSTIGGHIPGATNLPSEEWMDDNKVKEIVERHRYSIQSLMISIYIYVYILNSKPYGCRGKDKVVLHCMYSKVRGPSCALKFTEAIQEHIAPGQPTPEMSDISTTRIFIYKSYVF